MKTFTAVCAVLALLAGAAFGQASSPVPYNASSVTLTLSDPPQRVPSLGAGLNGNPGPRTLYYWIVTQATAGASSPAGPVVVANAPNTLGVTAGVNISWAPATGALTYDVLRTATAVPPTGACACAVATGVTGTTTTDSSDLLLAYTVATLDPNSLAMTLKNVSSGPGTSILSLPPISVPTLAVTKTVSGADATPPLQTTTTNTDATGAARRGGISAMQTTTPGTHNYGWLFRTIDNSTDSIYTHNVGTESNVVNHNTQAAAHGSDVYGAVIGLELGAGVWPGVGHRIEFTDPTHYTGQVAAGYATVDGVTPVAFEAGASCLTDDCNSQRINFYALLGGVRTLVGYITADPWGGMYLQSATGGKIYLNGLQNDGTLLQSPTCTTGDCASYSFDVQARAAGVILHNYIGADQWGNLDYTAAGGQHNFNGGLAVTGTVQANDIRSAALPLRVRFSNGGSVLGAATACGIAPRSGTITKIDVLGDVSGNATLDLSGETFAAYLAGTAATSLTNSHPVTFTGAKGVSVSTFTGWTSTTIAAGDVYCFALSAPSLLTSLSAVVTF